MKENISNSVFILSIIIIIMIYLIIQCNRYKTNKTDNSNKMNKNNKIEKQNETDKSNNEPFLVVSNKVNVKQSTRQKNIKNCIKNNLKDYQHSKKQENNPVEYTNNKTHIGPQNNFHQCFANGTHNIRDLGWKHWDVKYKNVKTLQNYDNNLDNPLMNNYLKNMKTLNLDNDYF